MSLYHVGDRVIVKNGFDRCEAGFVHEMAKLFGHVVTITEVNFCIDDYYYYIKEDPDMYMWSNDCFDGWEPVPEHDISLEGLL